uniref:Uncharacterized protein n=1 Tax=Anguilla anguilla TaxID=7936 RepID=A0A0E9PHU0_ANGAN
MTYFHCGPKDFARRHAGITHYSMNTYSTCATLKAVLK